MKTNQPACAFHPGAFSFRPGTLTVDQAVYGEPAPVGDPLYDRSSESPAAETTTRQMPSGEIVVVPSMVMNIGRNGGRAATVAVGVLV